ncbi:phosphatase PAP2 family protein [Maribacter confluentis]|uniref:Undecaprenyl-diphosphatase n=2 Tax=Maribacter TaxID=252356 RepID=A0ABY1SGT7_9FLAO|nr:MULTISPECIES: phosphatase PAP2 family protein [Maribacter]MDO1514741.1 phosphatase PAP2 family protein [Maribacter confluentis]TVZ14240.1 undecaprenyl-diphosphatase [Maribacter sp. MAR_2009_72]SNR46989.1 undecaprenyl-diphosphatase [Maribacter sedimenticola]
MKQSLFTFIKKLREFLEKKLHQYNTTLPYVITVVVALILVVGGINLFIELTDTLKTETLAMYDTQITDYIISYRTPALTKYFIFMTDVGDFHGYLIVLAIFLLLSLLVFRRWKYVVQATLVLGLATVSNMMLKRFIDRARPGIEHLVSVETLSYPSGHAMSAMAFYGFLMFLMYKFNIQKVAKVLLMFLLALIILSIGISRIYLGVHFPSDIAGGFIAGAIWVIFCVLVFDLIELFRRDPKT